MSEALYSSLSIEINRSSEEAVHRTVRIIRAIDMPYEERLTEVCFCGPDRVTGQMLTVFKYSEDCLKEIWDTLISVSLEQDKQC